jgi:hypothetical protein
MVRPLFFVRRGKKDSPKRHPHTVAPVTETKSENNYRPRIMPLRPIHRQQQQQQQKQPQKGQQQHEPQTEIAIIACGSFWSPQERFSKVRLLLYTTIDRLTCVDGLRFHTVCRRDIRSVVLFVVPYSFWCLLTPMCVSTLFSLLSLERFTYFELSRTLHLFRNDVSQNYSMHIN